MTPKKKLVEAIRQHNWYQEGNFVLSSGLTSDYYIDLRPCLTDTRYVHLATTCLIDEIRNLITPKHLICGPETSGLFLTGIMLQKLTAIMEISAIFVRTRHRTHGVRKNIVGTFQKEQQVIIFDDVATTGQSVERVIKVLVENGLQAAAVVTLVDRLQGARELFTNMGVPFRSVLTVDDLK